MITAGITAIKAALSSPAVIRTDAGPMVATTTGEEGGPGPGNLGTDQASR